MKAPEPTYAKSSDSERMIEKMDKIITAIEALTRAFTAQSGSMAELGR